MSGFKLIAIHVLENCMPEARKILDEDSFFEFYTYYNFRKENKVVSSITKLPNYDFGLYNIQGVQNEQININISAIVGKNGSGKSSILDLFYAFCLCISKDQDDIKKELEKLKRKANWGYILSLFNTLRIEVFYEENNFLKSLKYDGENGISSYYFDPQRQQFSINSISNFCYTIAINYSIHGLNELNSPWLSPMFHKNDGYQAPLVINPYRESGNIDINREYQLANSRLIQNLPLYGEINPQIINGKFLYAVDFKFDPKNLDLLFYDGKRFEVNQIILDYQKKYKKNILTIFNKLSSMLVGEELSQEACNSFKIFNRVPTPELIKRYVKSNYNRAYIEFWFIKYVIRKVFKICLQYSRFRENFMRIRNNKDNSLIIFKGDIEGILLESLAIDKSHVTLKLRQTIIMWHKRYFFEEAAWGKNTTEDDPDFFECYCRLNVPQLGKAIGVFNKDKTLKQNFDLERVPGGILKPVVLLERRVKHEINSKIETLSSGEQQLMFTIQTVIYHLKNLDSIFEVDIEFVDKINRYKSVVIILDEVELYFHPEYQRLLVRELLSQIKLIKLKFINNINIIFSTHSQFILSDVPSTNILKMEHGEMKNSNYEEKTFGANIHDLLANEFFLENGFMGEFAKTKINQVINSLRFYILENKISSLKSSQNADTTISKNIKKEYNLLKKGVIISKLDCEKIISIVGEPILYSSLMDLYAEAFPSNKNTFIDEQIKVLVTLKNKL